MNSTEKIFEKTIFKPVSIPFLFATLVFACLPFVPKDTESWIPLYICLFLSLAIFVFYCIVVICVNKLPHCKKGHVGVLIIIDTPTNKLYKDFVRSIREHFQECLTDSHLKTMPIFLNANRIKKYNKNDDKAMSKLLSETNCCFFANFFIETDNSDNPTQFNTKLNIKLSNTDIPSSAQEFLSENVPIISKPIRFKPYNKDAKIEFINSVSGDLRILSEYIIAVSYYMSNSIEQAHAVLDSLYSSLDGTHTMYNLICRTLQSLLFYEANLHIVEWLDSRAPALLDMAENKTLDADKISPGQYPFHLNYAKLLFLKYRDVASAKVHIAQCKKINTNDYWKYSEAFLIMYEKEDPNIVYTRYTQLKNNSYQDVLGIIKFIEHVLLQEPEKNILYLALGLLYENINDDTFANCNFRKFFNLYKGKIPLRNKRENDLRQKLQPCKCPEQESSADCSICKICTNKHCTYKLKA